METTKNEIIEIDIMFLLRKIWNKKIIIATTALLFAAVAVAYSSFVMKPKYESTTKIYAVTQNDTGKAVTVQDLQIGSNLVKDYQEIILSIEVLDSVIEENNLTITQQALASKISISSPKDTRVIAITVTDTDPNKASEIANSVRNAAAEKIKSITKVSDITTIEEAEPALAPSSPNIKRNGVIAFAGGLALAIIIILIIEILDDRVRRPEDIEEVMGLVLLGVVPDTKKGIK